MAKSSAPTGMHPRGMSLDSLPAPRGAALAEPPALPTGGRVGAGIRAEVVRLLREHTGHGPAKAKTVVGTDLIVVTLEGYLTTLEERLMAAGEIELVGATRHVIDTGIRSEAVAIVEERTHRSVTAYLSDQKEVPDVAVIAFVLDSSP